MMSDGGCDFVELSVGGFSQWRGPLAMTGLFAIFRWVSVEIFPSIFEGPSCMRAGFKRYTDCHSGATKKGSGCAATNANGTRRCRFPVAQCLNKCAA
ncbi:hypothetical protein EMIT0P12_30384 [Pseudomonas sp. IT-P12]